jgi:hypothetical protein
MRETNSSPSVRRSAVVSSVVGLLALACASVRAAEPPSPEPPTYTWSAELVAFYKGANTITAKSRLVSDAPDVEGLKPGDSAMLTWSGISTAAGVRAIERGTKSSYDHMSMPVEFVAEEGRYVSFKVPIPASDAAALGKVMPGNYITATSPQHPKSAKEAVTSIRPYTDVR